MAADPGVKVHLYGKPVRPGRKVGHVTALGNDLGDCATGPAGGQLPEPPARRNRDQVPVAG